MKTLRVAIIVIVLVAISSAALVISVTINQPNNSIQLRGPQSQFNLPLQPSTSQTGMNQKCKLTPSLIETETTPQQTEGPYFVDEKLDRSDIRSDPTDGSVQEGIPLRLVIHVYDINNGSCVPLSGTQVDIWHTNSQGLYSDIPSINTGGKKYIRGYQLTDNNGTVQFTTIYPGWYEGRALHIHVKVRTFDGSQKTFEWTSQFYLDDSISDKVQAQVPYSNHGPRPLTNNQDSIYTGPSTDGLVQSDSGKHLMLELSNDTRGYLGIFNIVVDAGRPK